MFDYVIGIDGYSRTGKDTFAKILVQNYGFHKVSLADPIREQLWNEDPLLDGRGMMAGYTEPLSKWVSDILGNDASPIDNEIWDFLKANTHVVPKMIAIGESARREYGEDYWLNLAIERAVTVGGRIVIPDIRHINEHQFIESRKPNALMVRMQKRGMGPANDSFIESAFLKCESDVTILNNGTIDDLEIAVDGVMRTYIFNRKLAA